MFSDSIFALSSGRLPSGIAVLRLTGPSVASALIAICGSIGLPRMLRRTEFRDRDGALIDDGLSVFFPAPRSYTGEDCAEFHLHGGRATVQAMLSRLSSEPGFRQADAGEFTRRAFLNGKMDLVQAESLADLLAAETEAQRRFAISAAQGRQSELYNSWRERMVGASALIEASLDFSDEGDVADETILPVWGQLGALATELEKHAASYHSAEIIRDGFDVVIVGPPNSGKSTLINALTNRAVSIVSEEPGTTRDLVEVALDVDGMKIRVTDTAGIRPGAGHVESMGIELATARAEEADLVLLLDDGANAGMPALRYPNALPLRVKADRVVDRGHGDWISALTGEGLDQLLVEIATRAREASRAAGDVLPLRTRHVEMLRAAAVALRSAVLHRSAPEIAAEEIRSARSDLGRLLGAVDPEELLDYIFSSFCIGK